MFKFNPESPQNPNNSEDEKKKLSEENAPEEIPVEELTPQQYKKVVRLYAEMEAQNRAAGNNELNQEQRKELRGLLKSFDVPLKKDPDLDRGEEDFKKAA